MELRDIMIGVNIIILIISALIILTSVILYSVVFVSIFADLTVGNGAETFFGPMLIDSKIQFYHKLVTGTTILLIFAVLLHKLTDLIQKLFIEQE